LFVESSRIDYVYTDEATESVLQPIEEAASPFFSYIQPINHPKSHKMKPLLTLLLCWGCLVLSAQTQPCQTPQHRSFDFWVGNWTVYHAEADTVVGYNEVKPILNSCVIEENWTSAKAGREKASILISRLTPAGTKRGWTRVAIPTTSLAAVPEIR